MIETINYQRACGDTPQHKQTPATAVVGVSNKEAPVARVTNLINKSDALNQLNAALKKHKTEYDKSLKEYTAAKSVYDKEIVAYNKAVVAAGIAYLKSLDPTEVTYRSRYGQQMLNLDFNVRVDLKEPELEVHEPSDNMVTRIEKQIRSVSIMAGETFNASMLQDDFFNCL